MKALLATLLLALGVSPALAQQWAGSLPLDSLSGKIVYRGRVVAKGASVATLRKRASTYTYQFHSPDTTLVFATTALHVGGRPDLSCRLAIQVADGSYRYELSEFTYFERGGEAFGKGGKIVAKEPNQVIPAEERLQAASPRQSAVLQAYQQEIVQAAEKTVAELQTAMR